MSNRRESQAYIGAPVRRLEDDAILRGAGAFLSDIHIPGALEIVIIRSSRPHAQILDIDFADAITMPGVVAALCGADMEIASRTLPCIDMRDGTLDARQRILPTDVVRYVGEPIAVIAAENRYQAEDAAERVRIEYRDLECVLTIADAEGQDGALIYPQYGTNVVHVSRHRDGDPERALNEADLVLEEKFYFHRHFAVPLEMRGVIAMPSDDGQRLRVWSTTQIPQIACGTIAGSLGLDRSQVSVTAPRLGGGFGSKENVYPEELIIPWTAWKLQRPVRWLEDRREHFVSSTHAREEEVVVKAAVRKDGLVTALVVNGSADIGCAFAIVGNTVPTIFGAMVRGPYKVPSLQATMSSVVTNKVPLNVFRGAGHPQAVLAMERILDIAAERLLIDRVEIRRRNLIEPSQLPLDRNASDSLGAQRIIYDEGDYPKCFEMALADAEIDKFAQMQADAGARGKVLGVGFSNHVEQTAIGPFEDAKVRLFPDGRLLVFSPVVAMGQGTEITLRQIAADELGVAIEAIDITFGDTDELPDALGAFASRGAAIGGAAVRKAIDELKHEMLSLIASRSNVDHSSLFWENGGVAGERLSEGRLSIRAIADLYPDLLPLTVSARVDAIDASYSYASHVAFVEIDRETFQISVPRYVVVHDCGTVINPLLVEGQIVGGVVQGLGGLLREELSYDQDGQLLQRGLMDYVLPGVSDAPTDFRLRHLETASSLAKHDVRGVGEGGVTGCYGAISTAIVSALRGRMDKSLANSSGPYLPHRLFHGCSPPRDSA